MLSREGDCVAPAGHPSWTEKTGSEPFDALAELAETVRRENACALPGVPIVYDRFMTSLLRATCRGSRVRYFRAGVRGANLNDRPEAF